MLFRGCPGALPQPPGRDGVRVNAHDLSPIVHQKPLISQLAPPTMAGRATSRPQETKPQAILSMVVPPLVQSPQLTKESVMIATYATLPVKRAFRRLRHPSLPKELLMRLLWFFSIWARTFLKPSSWDLFATERR